MKIDFHSHVKLSKKTNFSIDNFRELIKEAKEEGLTAITITEHFNTLNFPEVYDTLDKNYEYKDDYYDIDGFKAFTGMEVDVKENGHVLIIGNLRNIREVREYLNDYDSKESFISLKKLFGLCETYDMLIIGSHPFREDHPLYKAEPELLSRFNAFDLNGKDLFTYGIEEMSKKVKELGEEYNVPIVTGSDTHQYLQIGSVMTAFEKECNTVKEIKDEIKCGRYEISVSPHLNIKIKAATIIKSILKKQLEAK
ncbi:MULTISPECIES: PHP-associated domain-containing protein [unclassified Clostridium]|uniref:PHP domain-containing protein n=1 Tax=unclassified Clostridium TaxID=2614128 RepID=UPI000298648E|nr:MULTISPECIES: PHP-associated domain-containing protein [unclassified Clostridium]EKQ58051.1 MAG: putative metal-dependent phosphoesterase, PHP family [Clostridium sp. Maddingley MBC34-26]